MTDNEVPTIRYDEETFEEKLYINDKLVCCHNKLYPLDILYALAESGVIKLENR